MIVVIRKIKPMNHIVMDFAKTIFLRLRPWTNNNFNLPELLSLVYELKERKINNRGIINCNTRAGFNLPNFEITKDWEDSENAISVCLWPSSRNTLPVTELTPSSMLFNTDNGLNA